MQRPHLNRPRVSPWTCLLTVCLLAACEGGVDSQGTGPNADGDLPTADGAVAPPCSPACVAPQVCSAAGVCVTPSGCAKDSDCTAPAVCDLATKTCVTDEKCGAKEIKADPIQANLLIVLDRSCSMKKLVGGKSKWSIAVAALTKLVSNYKDRYRFGLTLFPDTSGGNCGQSGVPIPVGAGKEAAIYKALTSALQSTDANYPDGPCVTNIDTAMKQAANHAPLLDPTRDGFVLLITDGKQAGCSNAGGDSGTTQIIKDLRKTSNVSTFVLGFGGEVDPAQLDIFAKAGGKPAPGAKAFYDAADQKGLDTALAAIAKQGLGCVYQLSQLPATLSSLFVFLDNLEIKRDATHQGGWDFDPTTSQVTFYGQTCQDLQAGKVTDIDIVYGCRKPIDDGGCKPGQTVCKMPEDCPVKTQCVAGCCVNVLE